MSILGHDLPTSCAYLRHALLRHVFQIEFCVYYHRERNFFTDLPKKRLTNESHIICVVDPPQEENICGNFGKPLAFAPKIVYTIDMQWRKLSHLPAAQRIGGRCKPMSDGAFPLSELSATSRRGVPFIARTSGRGPRGKLGGTTELPSHVFGREFFLFTRKKSYFLFWRKPC